MKRRLPCAIAVLVVFLALDTGLHSQQVKKSQSRMNTIGPEAFVRSFYKLVVAHHPVAIPNDAKMKVFSPYLSKSLLNKIDMARACSADWDRQHPAPPILKPPFGWLESGLFSGGNEKVSPRLSHVERTELGKDGSAHVYVRLTWGSPKRPWIWQVAAIVVREDGRLAIDD